MTPRAAFLDAVGQTLNEFAGTLYTYSTAALPPEPLGTAPVPGAYVLEVESTHEFPPNGCLALKGNGGVRDIEVVFYGSKEDGRFNLITRNDARLDPHPAGTRVSLYTGNASSVHSALDKLRQAMSLEYAEGRDLSELGSNLGVPRPTGMKDERYRRLIRTLAYMEGRCTVEAIGRVLDILLEHRALTGTGAVVDAAARTVVCPGLVGGERLKDMRVRLAGQGEFRILDVDGERLHLDPRDGGEWLYQGATTLVDAEGLDWSVLAWDIIELPSEPGVVPIRINFEPPLDECYLAAEGDAPDGTFFLDNDFMGGPDPIVAVITDLKPHLVAASIQLRVFSK